MTTEFIHDVMDVPLRTRRCLVHFLAHNLFERNISKKKESMYFYKLSQGLGHGDHGLTNIWIFLTYHELSSLKFDWYMTPQKALDLFVSIVLWEEDIKIFEQSLYSI